MGDRVICKEFNGTEVRVQGEECLLLFSEDLLVRYVSADEIPE